MKPEMAPGISVNGRGRDRGSHGADDPRKLQISAVVAADDGWAVDW